MFCNKKISRNIVSKNRYLVTWYWQKKNRFLAKSDRDRLGLQIPRSAVSGPDSPPVSRSTTFDGTGCSRGGSRADYRAKRNKSVRTKMCLKEGVKITLQRHIWLQIDRSRLSAGMLQVVWRLFAGYLQSGIHISTFPIFLWCFLSISAVRKKTRNRRTDRPTDRWTDRPCIEKSKNLKRKQKIALGKSGLG